MKKELIQKIYEDACAKGFHTEYKSDQHWLIMVITEVAEAIEADRQNRYVKLNPTIKADKMFFASLSFTEVAYDLTKHIIVDEAFLGAMEAFLPNIIQYVYDWADSMGIDLDWFVDQKIRYNSLRESLHNKKY